MEVENIAERIINLESEINNIAIRIQEGAGYGVERAMEITREQALLATEVAVEYFKLEKENEKLKELLRETQCHIHSIAGELWMRVENALSNNRTKKAVNANEIKTCPFCGSRAGVYSKAEGKHGKRVYQVSCLATDANFFGNAGVAEEYCAYENEFWFDTEKEAIQWWNTRADG
jgi:hypothetical protein